MPWTFYRAVHGRVILPGKRPDGDSVRFLPDAGERWGDLKNSRRVRPSQEDGTVQLRLEGMDAPELHYGSASQPMGAEARAALLGLLGFTDVRFAGDGCKVLACEPDHVPATVLTRGADANGRIVAFVVPGAPTLPDGEPVRVDDALLASTANHHMVAAGMAYYLAYTTLAGPHQRALREAAREARTAGRGVHAHDRTWEFDLAGPDPLGPAGQLVMPKLFRRCTDYLADVERGFGGTLADWLLASRASRQRDEDDRVLVADRYEARLSDLLLLRHRRVALQADPLDLAFVEH